MTIARLLIIGISLSFVGCGTPSSLGKMEIWKTTVTQGIPSQLSNCLLDGAIESGEIPPLVRKYPDRKRVELYAFIQGAFGNRNYFEMISLQQVEDKRTKVELRLLHSWGDNSVLWNYLEPCLPEYQPPSPAASDSL